jgi:integrase
LISKRGNRWRVVVQGGRDPITRQRKQWSGSAATKAEAQALERRLMAESVGASLTNVTVAALVEEWWRSGPRLAATTKLNYRSNLNAHILPVLGERKVEEIRPRLVASYLRYLQEDKGLGPATARKVRTVLSAVFSYAVAMEYVESNPVMKVPPPELHAAERIAPTIEETARLLLAAERDDPEFLTYLWVAAEEGGRRGETLALRWSCIDFDSGVITIDSSVTRGEDGVRVRPRTKSGKSRRVAVSDVTLGFLEAHRRRHEGLMRAVGRLPHVGPESLVFSGGQGSRRHPLDGLPWRPDSTSRRFARLKSSAGVRADIDLHGLRHTMITELLAAGVDPRTVMGRAGHASEAMTMKLYAKVRPNRDAAAAALWGQMLESKMQELRQSSA